MKCNRARIYDFHYPGPIARPGNNSMRSPRAGRMSIDLNGTIVHLPSSGLDSRAAPGRARRAHRSVSQAGVAEGGADRPEAIHPARPEPRPQDPSIMGRISRGDVTLSAAVGSNYRVDRVRSNAAPLRRENIPTRPPDLEVKSKGFIGRAVDGAGLSWPLASGLASGLAARASYYSC